MPFLINLFGRMVAVDDSQYEVLIQKGFKVPSDDEVKQHVEQRTQVKESMGKVLEPGKLAVYLATVTQGGKDGYGIASAKLINEMREAGVDIRTAQMGQKVSILFHNPYSIQRLENPYRMIYTMFESDKIPDDWIDYLNAADKVIVPSKWCQSVFKKAGVETEVVPLGYDDKLFTFKKRENKRKADKEFVFLHYNAFNIRKGFKEVFDAFRQEFKPDEPVKMIFKTTLDHIPLPISPSQYPNIKIITGACSDQDLLNLCYDADAFVFPSRGEGFGMTPLEAMATGLPTIVPNASGHTEYFNDKYMFEAKVKETCPALYSRYKGQDVGKMVVCDVDQIRKQMRYIYEHQDEALAVGEAASEYVKQWTYEKTAIQLKALVEKVYAENLEDKPVRNILTLEKVR